MLSPRDLRRPLPEGWDLIVGYDTGTYMSATFTIITPDPYLAFTVEEFPNYRYVAGEIELIGISNPEWARQIRDAYRCYFPHKSKVHGWVDQNSQFKSELKRYNLALQSNMRKLELRVEISREYVLNGKWWHAPWLQVLPLEMEWAKWPDEATSSGKFERQKERDHTLDCVEHTLSRRPRTKAILQQKKESFKERFFRENRRAYPVTVGDPHLGRH